MARSTSFNADIVRTYFPAADTEITVTHGLNRVPLAAFVIDLSANSRVYKGTTAWTTTSIFLRASAASTLATVLVI